MQNRISDITQSIDASEVSQVQEFLARLKEQTDKSALNILFFPQLIHSKKVKKILIEECPENTIACSTVGQLSKSGFSDNKIVSISLPKNEFIAQTIPLPDIQNFAVENMLSLQQKFYEVRQNHQKMFPNGHMLALLLIDSLSMKEEIVTALISQAIDGTPLVGGSASGENGGMFVFGNSQFLKKGAILTLITTTRPFIPFKTQSFEPTNKKVVITKANPETRCVQEINGEPALLAYAKLIGKEATEITVEDYAKNPLMLKIGTENYVRSLFQTVNKNELQFYCTIETGLVLRLGKSRSLFRSTKKCFETLHDSLGEISFSLVLECFLRQKEREQLTTQNYQNLQNLYTQYNSIGFNTFGEQFGGAHINQTLSGVAFGKAS